MKALPGLTVATLFVILIQNGVEAATVEVQGVSAANPSSDKDKSIPETLEAYKAALQGMPFKNFKDLGHDSVKAEKAGSKGSAAVGGYSVEIAVTKVEKGKSSVNITVKEDGKAIGEPTSVDLVAGQAKMMKVGAADAPKILFFTLK